MARPTYAQIDLDAIIHNTRAIKNFIGGKKICAAVKADGYGHGAIAVAHAMAAGGVDLFGVAMTEEAVQLLQAGIQQPVILLSNAPLEDIETILAFDIRACITDFAFARALSAAAVKRHLTAPVHINIDTGMGRVGLPHESAAGLIHRIRELPGIKIEGLFTHFACSEDRAVSSHQLGLFKEIVTGLPADTMPAPLLHIANSAGTLQMPEAHLECIRPGLILYGLYPPHVDAGGIALRPALSLHSKIVFCKKVPAGTKLGYGHTFTTGRESLIATIPLGYHDGYVRQYSNLGEVLVRGRRVPVVGRICMDQTLVDVTGVEGAGTGDEVVVYGRQGDARISVEEMARRLDRIPYELTCAVGGRVRRRYLLNGAVAGETRSGALNPPGILENCFSQNSFDALTAGKTARSGAA